MCALKLHEDAFLYTSSNTHQFNLRILTDPKLFRFHNIQGNTHCNSVISVDILWEQFKELEPLQNSFKRNLLSKVISP